MLHRFGVIHHSRIGGLDDTLKYELQDAKVGTGKFTGADSIAVRIAAEVFPGMSSRAAHRRWCLPTRTTGE